jgi:energy-coupling factor transporter ATP-binding protein EcfA2
MTSPATAAPATGAAPFPSLDAMRAEHNELLRLARTGANPSGVRRWIRSFLARGGAAGAYLDASADRLAAQSLLDYWTATLFTLPGDDAPNDPQSRVPQVATLLADFDPSLAPDLDDQLCPYRGLSAFEERDSRQFFGREATVQQMLTQLRDQRLLLVVGASGSGKSSLVLAGLLPALKADGVPGSNSWRYHPTLVPGVDPLASLALLVKPSDAEPAAWMALQIPLLRSNPNWLRELLEAGGGAPAFVLVDQAEEVFTLCADAEVRRTFLLALLSLTSPAATAPHRLVLTLRADFVEQMLAEIPLLKPLLDDARVRLRPPLLTARELRHVIETPAQLVGLKFEEGIVEDLVKEVFGEEAALPLLQFALLKLWENRVHDRITWDAYRRVGGPRTALARTADNLYQEMIPEDQRTARLILLRLVQPALGGEFTRNRVRRETLTLLAASDRVNRVLNRLVGAGLLRLTRGPTPEEDRLAVTHEAIIRNWPRLADWLEQERERLQQRLRLRAAAELWLAHNRDQGGLLGGALLRDAEKYDDVEPLEKEFVLASRAVETEAEQAREKARAHELWQAKELARLKGRLARNLTRAVVAVAVLLVIAVALAIFAFIQLGIAGEEAAKAMASAKLATAKEKEAKTALDNELAAKENEKKAIVAKEQATFAADTVSAAQRRQLEQDSSSGERGFWRPGQTLRIYFMDGEPVVQEKVLAVARQWTEYANLKFERHNTPDAEIRISFKELGYWSFPGTGALGVPKGQPTMNFGGWTKEIPDYEIERVVLHEFGQALGLVNEMNNPKADIKWNVPAVLAALSGPPNNWTQQQIEVNIFSKAKNVGSWYRNFDPDSVMMYQIPAAWTTDGFSVGINRTLSESDKTFIRKLYPPDRPLRTLPFNAEWLQGEIKDFRQFDRIGFTVKEKGKVTLGVECDAGITLSVFRTAPEEKPIDMLNARYPKVHNVTWALEPGDYLILVSSSQIGGKGHYQVRLTTQPE